MRFFSCLTSFLILQSVAIEVDVAALTDRELTVSAREISVMLPRQRLSHDCTELNITTLLTLSAPAPARSSSVAALKVAPGQGNAGRKDQDPNTRGSTGRRHVKEVGIN